MYVRSTATADLSALPPDIAVALREYAETHQLVITDDLPAWITRSQNLPASSRLGRMLGRRANSADPDDEHQTLIVVHPTHLVIVISGAVRGVSVVSVPLVQASMSPGTRLGGADTADHGFSVLGFPGHEGQPGSLYLGLGPEPEGTDCAGTVRAAIAAAKNP